MSPPTPIPDQAHASAEAHELARPEAAIARASRRLRMITDLGDMAMILARAVHERALAEEVAAKGALVVGEAVETEPQEQPLAPRETVPARSSEQNFAAPRVKVRVRSRAGSPAVAPTPVMDAGALFTRLSDIVRQCLELEIRIDEDLRRLAAAAAFPRDPDATVGVQIEDTGQEATNPEDVPEEAPQRDPALQTAARDRVCAMVEAVIQAQTKTTREAQPLFTALRERLEENKVYRDLASRPDAVNATSLCRDLGIPPHPRWSNPPPDP